MDKTRTRSIRSRPTIDENRRLGFYAALFDEPTTVYDFAPGESERRDYSEIVKPGAFGDALKSTDEIIANVDHDPQKTFAKRSTGELLIQQDPKGLYCSCWLPSDDLGDQIARDIASGSLDGTSFRFAPVKQRWDGVTCELESVSLVDVCLTASPAYKATKGEVHLRTKASNRVNEYLARLELVRTRVSISTIGGK